ncbi:hypothetical protein ACQKGI_11935 [Peribacillus muralis]|uniref:hypothetical protein n=1 Tax=Peribacillus muralis TaxID=264697 RepID=UPI003822F41F
MYLMVEEAIKDAKLKGDCYHTIQQVLYQGILSASIIAAIVDALLNPFKKSRILKWKND